MWNVVIMGLVRLGVVLYVLVGRSPAPPPNVIVQAPPTPPPRNDDGWNRSQVALWYHTAPHRRTTPHHAYVHARVPPDVSLSWSACGVVVVVVVWCACVVFV